MLAINTAQHYNYAKTYMIIGAPGAVNGDLVANRIVATNFVDPSSSHLFHVTEHTSSLHFLVDTGADVSAVSPSCNEHIKR